MRKGGRPLVGGLLFDREISNKWFQRPPETRLNQKQYYFPPTLP